MLPFELIIRAVSIVFGLGMLVLAIILGGFVFIAFAGLILLAVIIFYIRGFFYKKKNIFDSEEKNQSNSNDTIIDAEYTVIDNKDSDD